MSDPNVLVERHDGWASLTLNRPHRKNAIIGPLYDELADALNDLSADETVAAIVLSGAGGAFSSGIDLTELQADPRPAWVPNMSSSTNAAHMALYNCQCPIIAAVERLIASRRVERIRVVARGTPGRSRTPSSS